MTSNWKMLCRPLVPGDQEVVPDISAVSPCGRQYAIGNKVEVPSGAKLTRNKANLLRGRLG